MNCHMSHPVRVRGLKQWSLKKSTSASPVAPRAGAWIETSCLNSAMPPRTSHPVRGRGLKLELFYEASIIVPSHPVRVRGLKL